RRGLAARDDQSVEALKLSWHSHLDDDRSQSVQDARVRLVATLKREDADGRDHYLPATLCEQLLALQLRALEARHRPAEAARGLRDPLGVLPVRCRFHDRTRPPGRVV